MKDIKLKASVKPEKCKCLQVEKYYKDGQLKAFCGAVMLPVGSLGKYPRNLF